MDSENIKRVEIIARLGSNGHEGETSIELNEKKKTTQDASLKPRFKTPTPNPEPHHCTEIRIPQ